MLSRVGQEGKIAVIRLVPSENIRGWVRVRRREPWRRTNSATAVPRKEIGDLPGVRAELFERDLQSRLARSAVEKIRPISASG